MSTCQPSSIYSIQAQSDREYRPNLSNAADFTGDVKASVSIVTYNHEKYIAQAIDSVLMQQTDFDYEIILGEDGSLDKTREICIEYSKRFPDRIRLFLRSRENVIRIGGRPTGRYNMIENLKACRGKYIALCDGDDYWSDPHKLQKQVGFLESHSEYALCHHDAISIDSDGNVLGDSWLGVANKRDMTASMVVKAPYFVPASVCFRNVFSELPSEFVKIPNGDTFLFSMLGLHGGAKYLGDQIEPSRYRIHGGGIWSILDRVQRTQRNAESFFWMGKYYARIGKRGFARHYLASSYHRTGRACALRGNRTHAVGWMLRALGQKPWSPTIWRDLFKVTLSNTSGQ